MFESFLEGQALWFSIPAMLGTGIFVIRIAMMLIGGDALDMDADAGGSLDGGDSSSAFGILSVQAVSAFLMGFGWVGIGFFLGANWGPAASFGTAFVGGLLMVWILGTALGAVRGLESSGNISTQEALGKSGDVYTRIPPKGEGRGQVQLVVSNRQRMFNAISEGPEFATNSRVVVLAVNDDQSLTVGAV